MPVFVNLCTDNVAQANPLARGVEGCMPGTTGAEMGYNAKKDAEEAQGQKLEETRRYSDTY